MRSRGDQNEVIKGHEKLNLKVTVPIPTDGITTLYNSLDLASEVMPLRRNRAGT